MTRSPYPSKLSLPQINPGVDTVLQYLILKFPNIEADVWSQRMLEGKVHWHDGSLITAQSNYQAQQRVYYYREVMNEPSVPFAEKIIFQDDQLLVAYKPHFLPVTPGGAYINECLQNRLRKKTGLQSLQALHRLDRDTAGLVLFSTQASTRGLYHQLFETRSIQKTYQAIALVDEGSVSAGQSWDVKNRLVKSSPAFLMTIENGQANSHSIIKCKEVSGNKALFELKPITGKTHQLRVHMQSLGLPILNDRYYPVLQDKTADDPLYPLQLLAKTLRFTDPISKQERFFDCGQALSLREEQGAK